MYKLVNQDRYNKLLKCEQELQECQQKYEQQKEYLQQILVHNQDIERDAGIYREWYNDMLEVENKMYDQKRYIDVFNTLPDNILNTFIEYLNRLKIEFLRLTVKRANEVEDLIYRNGLFTATTKFLEMFAQAKAIREG